MYHHHPSDSEAKAVFSLNIHPGNGLIALKNKDIPKPDGLNGEKISKSKRQKMFLLNNNEWPNSFTQRRAVAEIPLPTAAAKREFTQKEKGCAYGRIPFEGVKPVA